MKNFIKFSVFTVLLVLLIFTSCDNEYDSNFPLLTDEVVSFDQSLDQQKLHEINQLLLENGYAPYTEERLLNIKQKITKEGLEFRSCGADPIGDISSNSCSYGNPTISGIDLVIMNNIIRDYDYDEPPDYKVHATEEYDGTTYQSCVVVNAATISYLEGEGLLYHLDTTDVNITAYFILYGVCP